MFRRRFINFSLRRLREKLQNVPQLGDGFCVEFCHVLSRCHLRERIHDPDTDSVFRIALKD